MQPQQKLQYTGTSSVRKGTSHAQSSSKSVQNSSAINYQNSLPTGWRREESLKQNGLFAGKTDISYISPTGQKVKNKDELQKILGSSYDVSNFDWRTGKFVQSRKRVQNQADETTHGKIMKLVEEHSGRLIRSVPDAIGQEMKASIETTVVDSAVNTDLISAENSDSAPRQLLWFKRLSDVHPYNPDTEKSVASINLPPELQNAGIPGLNDSQIFQSIVSCLFHSTKNNVPVVGQIQQKSSIEKNPCLTITASQPLVKQILITDDIITRQEAKVKDLRKKLERVRRTLLPKLQVGDAA